MRYPEAASSGDVSAATHTSRGGPTVQYNYQNGQLLSLTEVATGNPILWRADTRHVLGMVTAATYGSPSDHQPSHRDLGLQRQYAPSARATTSAASRSGPVPAQTFTYFDNGQARDRARSSGHQRALHLRRARSASSTTYHRDDGAGQKLVDATFSYDDNGITGIDTTASNVSRDWGPPTTRR